MTSSWPWRPCDIIVIDLWWISVPELAKEMMTCDQEPRKLKTYYYYPGYRRMYSSLGKMLLRNCWHGKFLCLDVIVVFNFTVWFIEIQLTVVAYFSTWKPGEQGRHCADDIFKCIVLKKIFHILNPISRYYVSRVWLIIGRQAINRASDDPVNWNTGVTRPEWANSIWPPRAKKLNSISVATFVGPYTNMD